jgi:hypothetical protein
MSALERRMRAKAMAESREKSAAPQALQTIRAVKDALNPRGVIEIPADRLAEAALEILLRGPA